MGEEITSTKFWKLKSRMTDNCISGPKEASWILSPQKRKLNSCGSVGKESACNAGDLDSTPELGRTPREGKGYPLLYSSLENSTDYGLYSQSIGLQRVGHNRATFTSLALQNLQKTRDLWHKTALEREVTWGWKEEESLNSFKQVRTRYPSPTLCRQAAAPPCACSAVRVDTRERTAQSLPSGGQGWGNGFHGEKRGIKRKSAHGRWYPPCQSSFMLAPRMLT